MSANPLSVPLESIVRAYHALEQVQNIKSGEPLPFEVSLQVAEALGYMRSAMKRLGREQIEVVTA